LTVLALAAFGSKTKNRNDPISVLLPKVANTSTLVTATCRWCLRFHLKNIANVHEPKPKSMIDLLVNMACFVKKENNNFITKGADLN
jgi:hypothetical protein